MNVLKSLTDPVFHACVPSWAIGVDRHLLTIMEEIMIAMYVRYGPKP